MGSDSYDSRYSGAERNQTVEAAHHPRET